VLARARWLPEVRDNEARRSDAVRSATSRGERRVRRQDAAHRRLRQIGGRLVWLATAFDMRVIGIPSDPSAGAGHADAVHAMSDLNALLPRADFIALTCPLTAETRPRYTKKNQ
jgi:phosphoglycerate dehydrogenase-like enzyme